MVGTALCPLTNQKPLRTVTIAVSELSAISMRPLFTDTGWNPYIHSVGMRLISLPLTTFFPVWFVGTMNPISHRFPVWCVRIAIFHTKSDKFVFPGQSVSSLCVMILAAPSDSITSLCFSSAGIEARIAVVLDMVPASRLFFSSMYLSTMHSGRCRVLRGRILVIIWEWCYMILQTLTMSLRYFLEKIGLMHPDPKRLISEWRRSIRNEEREINRSLFWALNQQEKIEEEIRALVAKGQRVAAVALTEHLIDIRRAVARLHVAKSHLNTLSLNLRMQLATVHMTGAFQKSTDILISMNKLIQLPETMTAMNSMLREMDSVGMVQDLMDDVLDSGSVDDCEVEEEVDKVIAELTMGIFNSIDIIPTTMPATLHTPTQARVGLR